MRRNSRALAFFAAVFMCLGPGAYAQTSTPAPTPDQKERIVTDHASGTFDVKISPQNEKGDDPSLGRFSIDKQFHGELEATSKGQMLTAGNGAKGFSGGYVAIEKVTGSLRGRSGTFVLQHSGTITQGTPQLSITVVPGSGTGQLAGLAGSMTIKIAGGQHSYQFDYTLP
jgi:hypothetical protein